MPRPMLPPPDDTRADDGGDASLVRLSTTQVVTQTGFSRRTVQTAARLGLLAGSVRDERGRWWHDPEAVRRWQAGDPGASGAADPPVRHRRASSWWRHGALLTADGVHSDVVVVDPETGCWVWQAGCSPADHPIARFEGRPVRVRRELWQRRHGPLPAHRQVRRTCAEGRCVNPDHGKVPLPRPER